MNVHDKIKKHLVNDLLESGLRLFDLEIVDIENNVIELLMIEQIKYEGEVKGIRDLEDFKKYIEEAKDIKGLKEKYLKKFIEKIKDKLNKTKYFKNIEIISADFDYIFKFGDYCYFDLLRIGEELVIECRLIIKLKLDNFYSSLLKLSILE
ncbi:MAG: hypothetical protein QXW62_06590 [Candidatus Methanomethylicaceae archaeon]